MATISKFEDLVVWQKARTLCQLIGKHIDSGCFGNNFKLINQMEGSSGSIMDNIAEGFERSGNREFLQFLYIAKGSCGECRSQLYRALDRGYLKPDDFRIVHDLAAEILCLLQGLIRYLEQSEKKGFKYLNR